MQRMETHSNSESKTTSKSAWSLHEFVDLFEPHISPELLAIVLVDILAKVETLHRLRKSIGVIDAETIILNREGSIDFIGDRSASTHENDLYRVATLFQSVLLHYGRSTFRWSSARSKWRRDRGTRAGLNYAARIHPLLKRIIRRATDARPKKRYKTAWKFRSDLLDFIYELNVSSETFFTRNFFRDPVAYTHELTRIISARECKRVEAAAKWAARWTDRRSALQELAYLLELAPGHPKALALLHRVRHARRRKFAQLGYSGLILFLVALGGNVILSKLDLIARPPTTRPKPLVIEQSSLENNYSRSPSGRRGYIDITEETAPASLLSIAHPKMGQIILNLDDDAAAYFDASPGVARRYTHGNGLWLPEGAHTLTIIKPGYPQAISHIRLMRGTTTTITARATEN